VRSNLTGLLYIFRNVAEQLVERGLASVVRHGRDDEERSPDYDKLMAAEHACVFSPLHCF
jgi:staphylococcal nuclease domain-containing protein 1